MTLKSEDACAALAAWLTAAAGLPDALRNDMTLSGFSEAAAGVGWKLAVLDDDIVELTHVFGEPHVYELEVRAEILLAVEGQPGPIRDGVFSGAMAALAAALFDDRTLGGAVEDIRAGERVERDHLLPETGQPPVETARLTVAMIVTANSPLG